MARPVWSGSVTFGLVSIPVALYSATEDRTVRFHQFERGTRDRVRYQRVNERTGDEVAYDDIVKGYDLGGGEHVLLDPSELEDVAPGRSRALEISAFVDLDEIDPVHFQRTYYVGPSGEEHARTYALLREALARTGRAGVATFVMRNREYLTAMRAHGDVLVLDTLLFADEVRDPSATVRDLPGRVRLRDNEVETATQLVDSMTSAWDPTEYEDSYRARVEELVEARRTGEEVVAESGPPEATGVVDLMDALQRSVDEARGRRGERSSGPARSSQGRKQSSRGRQQSSQGRQQSSRGRKRSSRDDLTDATKADLYAEAGRLDLRGRSSMSRDALEEAVREARASSGKTRRRAS
jgi:DNA end-binding protein Ku